NTGNAPTGLPSALGYDEYKHKPWTDKKPKIKKKPLKQGKTIKGTIKWDVAEKAKGGIGQSFDSPNTDIRGGSNRKGHKQVFGAWVWHFGDEVWKRNPDPTD